MNIVFWYFAIGWACVLYFILFVRTPVMEELEAILFRRDLKMPKAHRFPYAIGSFLLLSFIYPWFLVEVLLNIIDGSTNVTEDLIDAYKQAVWDDIEEENNL